jgi:hypothetical protein
MHLQIRKHSSFQIGSGWYETTPQHRSPDQVQLTGNVFTGQNYNIQTQLTPFTYGQTYLNRYRDFPYMNEGFKLQKVVDNNKSWLSDDDKLEFQPKVITMPIILLIMKNWY